MLSAAWLSRLSGRQLFHMLKCQKRRAGAIDQSMNQVNLFTGEGSNASSEVLGKTRVMEKEREVN